MLGLQLFAHRESHRALVERLISSDGHPDLIADAQEHKATLGQIERHLTDDLVEALREKLLAHWADAALPRLTLHQFLVEHLSQSGDVDSRRWLVAHVLDPLLAVFLPLSWRQNRVEHVFLLGSGLHRRELSAS